MTSGAARQEHKGRNHHEIARSSKPCSPPRRWRSSPAPRRRRTRKVAVDLTTLTSPFWTSYNKYIVEEAKAQGIDLLEPFNSEFDTAKQITGVQNAIQLGAKGIIFSPFDSAAAGTVLNTAEKAGVQVVAVDVAPTTGPVAIVVRANNVAYGEKACQYIGEHVAEGPVVQIMGDQASINGRDRGNGFRDCITKNFPKLKLLEIPTRAWSGEDAAAGLDTILNSTPGSEGDLHARRRRLPRADAADAEAQGHAASRR